MPYKQPEIKLRKKWHTTQEKINKMLDFSKDKTHA